ncbi:MAG: hypothetical protein ACE5FI_16405 [Anaerolineales bacterium]
MADNLSDVVLALGRDLGILTEGQATGGSTTTIVDSALGGSDDDYNDGWALVVRDGGGASAAPEGEFNRVSDYVSSSGTITVDTAFTAAVASGDSYAVATALYPLNQIRAAVNRALQDRSKWVPAVDTSSLTTASAQTEYALPVAAKGNLLEVYIQTRTNDSNDNQWRRIHDWDAQPQTGAAGSTGLLIFPRTLPVSRTLKLVYLAPQSAMFAYSDKLHELIWTERLVKEAKVQALMWQLQRGGTDDPLLLQLVNDAKRERELARLRMPVVAPQESHRFPHNTPHYKNRFTSPDPA